MELSDFFAQHPKAALAFSGGADSAFLLYSAAACGADIMPYFVRSQFQPAFERADARRMAAALGVPLTAAQAAYSRGGAWHEALKQYLDENFAFVKAFLSQELPEAVMYIPEATYLAWVDLSRCLPDVADLPDFFANKAGVLLEGGDSLFVGNAKGYVRLNLAMPRAIIQTGLERMRDAIREEQAKH